VFPATEEVVEIDGLAVDFVCVENEQVGVSVKFVFIVSQIEVSRFCKRHRSRKATARLTKRLADLKVSAAPLSNVIPGPVTRVPVDDDALIVFKEACIPFYILKNGINVSANVFRNESH
jgi:hypothetical protein